MPHLYRFTVPQLKEELKKRNISFGSRALKAELKSTLQAAIDKSTTAKASGSGTKRARSDSVEAAGPSTTTKKQKKTDPSPTKSTASTSAKASKSTSKSTSKSSKPKDPSAPVKPFLPPAILSLIKTFLPFGPDHLRTHLAFAGTSKFVKNTCYAGDGVWKELATKAGYGRPKIGLAGAGYGNARPTSWRILVRQVVNCPAFDKVLEEGKDEVIEDVESFTPLKPEQVVEQNLVVTLDPCLSLIEGRPSSLKSLTVDCIERSVELGSTPSVAYALACYPPLEIMGVMSLADKPFKHFAYANNAEGVTVHDFWNAVCKSGQDTVSERELLPIFLASNPNFPKMKHSWSEDECDEYDDWLQHDMNGAHISRMATLLDVMAPSDASFDGDIEQLGSGCILFSVGMDY